MERVFVQDVAAPVCQVSVFSPTHPSCTPFQFLVPTIRCQSGSCRINDLSEGRPCHVSSRDLNLPLITRVLAKRLVRRTSGPSTRSTQHMWHPSISPSINGCAMAEAGEGRNAYKNFNSDLTSLNFSKFSFNPSSPHDIKFISWYVSASPSV